jgi:hypothetical protein
MKEIEKRLRPQVVYGGDTAVSHDIDTAIAADTMEQLDISDQTIGSTTLYPDSDNHFANNGIAYPKTLGRLRHFTHPHLKHAPGPIVKISTRVRGNERTDDAINRTLAHELVHIAQMDRNDPRLKIGQLSTIGMTALGAVIGNKLGGSNRSLRAVSTIVGMAVGQRIGYQIDPAERQARALAKDIQSPIVTRRNRDSDLTQNV